MNSGICSQDMKNKKNKTEKKKVLLNQNFNLYFQV